MPARISATSALYIVYRMGSRHKAWEVVNANCNQCIYKEDHISEKHVPKIINHSMPKMPHGFRHFVSHFELCNPAHTFGFNLRFVDVYLLTFVNTN